MEPGITHAVTALILVQLGLDGLPSGIPYRVPVLDIEVFAVGVCGYGIVPVSGDAEKLDFADESFDVVISRNLTWTLPHPIDAYQEWMRVLKKGGVLINFDAEYAKGAHN